MPRRARFTQAEINRIFGAAKSAGVHVRIVLTKDGFVVETIDLDKEPAAPTPRGLRVLEAKDIVL
ncbi:hypothetical protein GCM10007874_11530 [Labrys miyagiensis]|uniref:Uncharacterized protein n=1 Tax=Labrys miyagiensis TaxID=346912 RepID=A0ABQ6CCR1_9HYPH|nr:hypothetical protein GCM10007874_11530 [Labrys miyagiensis]